MTENRPANRALHEAAGRLVVGLCLVALGASHPIPLAAEPSFPALQALVEQGTADRLLIDPVGRLIVWDRETGTGYVFESGSSPAEPSFRGPSTTALAFSPGGRRAFVTDVGETVEVHLPDGSNRKLDVGHQIGRIEWLDDRRLAISPTDAEHRVELWDVDSGERLRGIDNIERISETPGFRPLRTTELAWDREGQRLHALDAFTGLYRAYDLSEREVRTVAEARIDDRSREQYEERFARFDRQLREQGEFQGAAVWRFSVGLSADGTAWMVERCEEAGDDEVPGNAHLLAVDGEGDEHRLTVETDCCSLTAVPWGDLLAFVRAARPDPAYGAGCFATVPLPDLATPASRPAWVEVTPLTPSREVRSRETAYEPARVARIPPGASVVSVVTNLLPDEPCPSLVCAGGGGSALWCAQLWLDPRAADLEARILETSTGRPVIGQVTSDGAGLAGASIALVPADLRSTRLLTLPLSFPAGEPRPSREISTGADGHFRLPALAAGDYRLVVRLPGGRVDTSHTFTVPAPRRTGPVERVAAVDLGALDYASGLRVEVAVSGPEGRPVPEAVAGAAQEGPAELDEIEALAATALYEVEVDGDGRASIDGLEPDLPVVVTCRAPGHDLWRERFEAPPSLVECRLDRLGEVSGRIVDDEGTPVTGAHVTLTGGSSFFAGATERAATDDDGQFRFVDLEAGDFRLVAASHGRVARARSFTLETGAARDVGDLVLEAAESWRHRIVDENGEPVAGAVLRAVSPAGGVAPGTTDAWGEVELRGPATGPLALEVRADGFAPRRVEVPESVRTPDAEPHEVVLERAGWVRARVWDAAADTPCVGCRITLAGPGPTQSLVTDGSGTATSEPLAPGLWQASPARLQGYGAVVTRSGGGDVRAVRVIPGTTTEVRFGDEDDEIEVVLSPPPREAGAWSLVVRTGGDVHVQPLHTSGTATVPRPRGRSLVSLTGGGVTVRLGFLDEDTADPAVLELPAGVLSARLPAQPDSGALLRLSVVDAARGRSRAEVLALAGGEVRVPFLPAGVYEVRSDGRVLATVAVEDGRVTALGPLDQPGPTTFD